MGFFAFIDYRGLLLWRYVYSDRKELGELFAYSPKQLEEFKCLCKPKYETFAWYQGVGRHSKDQVIKSMTDDLKTLSSFMGNKTYLLGDEPCAEDASVFGMLAQIVWADLDSPYKKLVSGKTHIVAQ
jgi:hypothetical protein